MSSPFGAMLACAVLFGCAQLDQAPAETEPQTPPPSVAAPPAAQVPPPAPQASARSAPAVAAPSAPSVASMPVPKSPGDAAKARQERGRISMYGKAFAGRKTASGEPFDPAALTMAHRTLPFGTRVRVTNLENQRSVDVVVNDRGPFVAGRVADLSEAAARRLGMIYDGVVEAILDVSQPDK